MNMKKRGLSTVIATLIIILISITAIVIMWVVIQNIISKGSENIDLGKFTIDLEIEQVTIESDGIYITVKRNSGKGELKKIKFMLSDGVNTETFEQDANIPELGIETFILTGLPRYIKKSHYCSFDRENRRHTRK